MTQTSIPRPQWVDKLSQRLSDSSEDRFDHKFAKWNTKSGAINDGKNVNYFQRLLQEHQPQRLPWLQDGKED